MPSLMLVGVVVLEGLKHKHRVLLHRLLNLQGNFFFYSNIFY